MREVADKLIRSDTLTTEGTVELVDGRSGCPTSRSPTAASWRTATTSCRRPPPPPRPPSWVPRTAPRCGFRAGTSASWWAGQAHKRSVPRLIEFIKASSEVVDAERRPEGAELGLVAAAR